MVRFHYIGRKGCRIVYIHIPFHFARYGSYREGEGCGGIARPEGHLKLCHILRVREEHAFDGSAGDAGLAAVFVFLLFAHGIAFVIHSGEGYCIYGCFRHYCTGDGYRLSVSQISEFGCEFECGVERLGLVSAVVLVAGCKAYKRSSCDQKDFFHNFCFFKTVGMFIICFEFQCLSVWRMATASTVDFRQEIVVCASVAIRHTLTRPR